MKDNRSKLDKNESFLEAYSIFQRLALAIEVVTTDLKHHKHSTHRMWRSSSHTVSSILRDIFTELVIRDVNIPVPLPRDVIPYNMRCLVFSTYRDTRDFIVLRHLMEAAEFYYQVIDKV